MDILNHTPTKMKALTSVIAVSCILLSLSGCQKQTGGGVRKTAAKITSYGTSAGKQLKFVIFTDIAGGYISILEKGDWSGRLEPEEGLDVHYKGNLFGVVINGVKHKFTDGRIFLVETKGETLSVQQLNISIGSAPYDAEIDRIAELDIVQNFLNK